MAIFGKYYRAWQMKTADAGGIPEFEGGAVIGPGSYLTWLPSTADKGSFRIVCADQTGDTAVTLTVDAMAAARAIHLADPGKTAYIAYASAALTPAEMDVLDAVTAGTVTALKAVVVDASKNIGDFGNLDAVNIDLGASGTAGSLDIFPTTASKGKNTWSSADNAGDTTNTFTNASMAGARTFTVQDPNVGTANLLTNSLKSRYRLEWVAGQRGKPSLNGDMQNAAEATRMIADPDFEILGTNASSDDSTFYAEGGITLETDGADSDSVILLPHLDTNQTAWSNVTWGTDQQTRWECRFKTGASITDTIIWAGLKLTNTDVVATDADQVFFRYEEGVNDGEWQAVSSVGDSDDAHDTNVVVAINTEYHLVIDIQADRTAKMYINGVLVETSAALTDATDFIPYIGVMCQAGGASGAKSIHVRGQAIERNFA